MIDVTAAIIAKDKKILIAQRKSTDRLPNKWEFPGGKVEKGETLEECLIREMKEEFTIDVTIGKFIGESIYHYDHLSIRLLAYHTYWRGGDFEIKSHKKIKWIPLDDINQYDFAPADIPFVEKLRRGEIEF